MKYWYECDNCEDMEPLDTIVNDGWYCECGGAMNLVKKDHYEEVEYIENCMICINRNTNKCSDCRWQ